MSGKKNEKTKTDLRTLPKDKRPKPSSGQSAPERALPYEALSDAERLIVKTLNNRGQKRTERSVEYLAELMDGDDAKLQVRNALRRPVACGWVENIARGMYRISEKGRKRLERL